MFVVTDWCYLVADIVQCLQIQIPGRYFIKWGHSEGRPEEVLDGLMDLGSKGF